MKTNSSETIQRKWIKKYFFLLKSETELDTEIPFGEASTIATDVKNEGQKDDVMKTVATIETGTELKPETEFNTRPETKTETKTATETELKMEIGTQVETEMESTTEIEFSTQGSPRTLVFFSCLKENLYKFALFYWIAIAVTTQTPFKALPTTAEDWKTNLLHSVRKGIFNEFKAKNHL